MTINQANLILLNQKRIKRKIIKLIKKKNLPYQNKAQKFQFTLRKAKKKNLQKIKKKA